MLHSTSTKSGHRSTSTRSSSMAARCVLGPAASGAHSGESQRVMVRYCDARVGPNSTVRSLGFVPWISRRRRRCHSAVCVSWSGSGTGGGMWPFGNSARRTSPIRRAQSSVSISRLWISAVAILLFLASVAASLLSQWESSKHSPIDHLSKPCEPNTELGQPKERIGQRARLCLHHFIYQLQPG